MITYLFAQFFRYIYDNTTWMTFFAFTFDYQRVFAVYCVYFLLSCSYDLGHNSPRGMELGLLGGGEGGGGGKQRECGVQEELRE